MNNSVAMDAPGLRGVAAGTARLMFYTLLSILLMTLDFRGQYVDRVQALAGRAVEPIMLLIDWPQSQLRTLGGWMAERQDAAERLSSLERALLEAEAGLMVVDDLAQENARLRSLLEIQQRMSQPLMVAELAAVDMDPFSHRMLIKRGSSDGVEVGMPVLDERGVIGQVEYAFAHTARVILLSDPDHALPVQVLPSGDRTIAYGTGTLDRLRLSDLPMNAMVEPDQLVVTSGLGGRFPMGLAVGRIVSIERLPGQPFATAELQLLAATTRNRAVLILASSADKPVPPTTASDSRQSDPTATVDTVRSLEDEAAVSADVLDDNAGAD
ncbi:MAG: rod shape-determining protein MreC [Pseudomonadota bacterium]